MTKSILELQKNFGSVDYDGKTYTLTQDAYPADDGLHYQARAIDQDSDLDDPEYLVKWRITHPDPASCDDESEMCNWGEADGVYRFGTPVEAIEPNPT